MTNITRRSAFAIVPAMGAAAIAPASAEPTHPVQRLRELQEEASELMHSFNDHMGGRWALHIRASDDALPAFYENLCAGSTDPLLEAIEAFREGNRQFCALRDDFAPYADEDAAIEATYGPPLDVLDEWDQPARSLDGARAALRIVLQEGCLGNRMEASMLRAVLAYLDREART